MTQKSLQESRKIYILLFLFICIGCLISIMANIDDLFANAPDALHPSESTGDEAYLFLPIILAPGEAPSDFAGLLFGDEGIEPGNPSDCEATPPNRCWYVDADAPDGGDGTFENPFNSFEEVVGYETLNVDFSYVTGLLAGGDYLYITGTFDLNDHIDSTGPGDPGKSMRLVLRNPAQSGTPDNPTVIKSYRGQPRAVFDGQFRQLGTVLNNEVDAIVQISSFSTTPFNAVVIQNIEVQHAFGLGISFLENVQYAEVISVVVHDTAIRDGASSRGGIHFRMADETAQPQFIVRNSLFYRNYLLANGTCCFDGTGGGHNNTGGINILTEPTVQDDATITITQNIIRDEWYAIRHKHSGNVNTIIHNNIIDTAQNAIYIRAFADNQIHHNLIKNVNTALFLEAENQKGDMTVTAYNNTIVDSERLLDIGFDNEPYRRDAYLYNNIFSSTLAPTVIMLGEGASNNYDLNQWTSEYNLFDLPPSANFLRHEGTIYNFVNGLSHLNDTTSFAGDPLFVDPDSDDYALSPGSDAIGAGLGGVDLGAFPSD